MRMDSSFDVDSFTTLPRKKRDRLPSIEELQAMSLERRLASLNISRSVVPVPPPRMKKVQKRMSSLPDQMSPPSRPELYAERSKPASFDSSVEFTKEGLFPDEYNNQDYYNGYSYSPETSPLSSPTKEQYLKYEVSRKGHGKDVNGYKYREKPKQPLCDIIESSQQTSDKSQLRRPDILRGSFNADLRSKMLTEDRPISHTGRLIQSKMSSKDKARSQQQYHQQRSPTNGYDDHKNLLTESRSRGVVDRHQLMNSRHPDLDHHPHKEDKDPTYQMSKSTSSVTGGGSNNRFMFYRPKVDKMPKQSQSAIGLVNMAENSYGNGGSHLSSPEGSFVNPAFDIKENHRKAKSPTSPDRHGSPLSCSTPVKPKPVPISNRQAYSTMGSSFSLRPCTPSPPSQRFRNHQKAPLPEPAVESKPPKVIPPKKLLGPSPLKPLISAKHLESSLKQYSTQSNRLDTSDMCSPQALESMMKYYNMKNEKTEDSLESDSPTPPPSRLSSSKKNSSPYSSSSSLNISGDSIDIVLRRKKKIRIRPPSISSDDESVKRVSLEINLTPGNDDFSRNIANKQDSTETSSSNWKGSNKSLNQSQTSLNHTVEKLELDDLTTTETAKLLRKQFAKLKVKANNLKVKDNELKQRFVLLQNQRGRVCGHGGSITKSKLRASPVLL